MSPERKAKKRRTARRIGGSAPLWFVAGGLVAVLVIFGFPALRNAFQHAGHPGVQPTRVPAHELAKNAPAMPTNIGAAQFDFYRMLSHPTQILTSSETAEVQQAPTTKSVAKPGAYVLQVASFRAQKDADALKAQLALWGIAAHVQAVNVQGETWHRVRIGPVSDLDSLNSLRTRLATHKLKPLLIRVGG